MYRNLSWSEEASWAAAIERAGLGRERARGAGSRASAVRASAVPAALPAEPRRPVESGGDETEAADLPSRLHRFAQAVVDDTRAHAVFVSDESGLEVVRRGGDGPWVALAGQALRHLAEMRLALRSDETPAATFALDSGLRLHVIEVATDHGRFALGVVGVGIDVDRVTAYRSRLQALMC